MTNHAGRSAARHLKSQTRSGGATLMLAGLAIAIVAAGVGGGVATAVHLYQFPHIAAESAAPVASQRAANVSGGSVEQVAAKVLPSVVALQTDAGNMAYEGSGIILTTDGLIMTNAHVVAVAASANQAGSASTVTLADGRTMPFTVVAADPITDVAVVRAQGVSGLTPITLGTSGNLRVGEQVVAV